MRRLIIIAVVVALAVVGWLLWRQRQAAPLVVSGFIEADQIRAGSRVGGRVAEVRAVEGQHLKSGDVLFRIEPFDLNERLASAQAELAAARAEHDRLAAGYRPEEVQQAQAERDRLAATLAKLVAGPRPLEIEIAQQRLNVAQANLELAEVEQKRLASMEATDTASRIEVERANREAKTSRYEAMAAQQELALLKEGTRQEEIAEAKAALAEAEAALELRKRGYRAEEIEQAASRLAAAEANVKVIQSQLEELTVRSPGEVVVEAIDLQPGDLVAPNAPAVSLLDTDSLWIRTYVPEARLGQASVGQRVPIRIDSYPNERFIGTITYVSPDAEFTPRNVQTAEERSNLVFRTKIAIEDPKAREKLRVGMMGDVLLDEAVTP